MPSVKAQPDQDWCGALTEYWEELGKPKGWNGCSLPKGHKGNHTDEEVLDAIS